MTVFQQKIKALESILQVCSHNNCKLLYATVVGSHAYGNATPDSDLDVRFVFLAPENHYLGFGSKDHISIGGEDVSGYEIKKWILLLTDNNPTTLEMLFMEPESKNTSFSL